MVVRFLAVAGAALLLFPPVSVVGQELQGRLVGVVTDETGAVLPGVTVTASSAALIGYRSR